MDIIWVIDHWKSRDSPLVSRQILSVKTLETLILLFLTTYQQSNFFYNFISLLTLSHNTLLYHKRFYFNIKHFSAPFLSTLIVSQTKLVFIYNELNISVEQSVKISGIWFVFWSTDPGTFLCWWKSSESVSTLGVRGRCPEKKNILLWSKKIYFCQFCKNYKDAHPTMIYFCSWMIYICIFLFLLENDDGIEWYFRCCVTTDPVIIWAAAIWDMNNWSWKWWPVFVNNAGYWGNIAGAGPSFDCLGAATCEWAHNGQSRLLRIN